MYTFFVKLDRDRSFLSTQGQSSSSRPEHRNHLRVGSLSVCWSMLTVGWEDSHCWSSQSEQLFMDSLSFCFDFSQYGRKISKERGKPNGTCGLFVLFCFVLWSRRKSHLWSLPLHSIGWRSYKPSQVQGVVKKKIPLLNGRMSSFWKIMGARIITTATFG